VRKGAIGTRERLPQFVKIMHDLETDLLIPEVGKSRAWTQTQTEFITTLTASVPLLSLDPSPRHKLSTPSSIIPSIRTRTYVHVLIIHRLKGSQIPSRRSAIMYLMLD
jgi:hypothetical protein